MRQTVALFPKKEQKQKISTKLAQLPHDWGKEKKSGVYPQITQIYKIGIRILFNYEKRQE